MSARASGGSLTDGSPLRRTVAWMPRGDENVLDWLRCLRFPKDERAAARAERRAEREMRLERDNAETADRRAAARAADAGRFGSRIPGGGGF